MVEGEDGSEDEMLEDGSTSLHFWDAVLFLLMLFFVPESV